MVVHLELQSFENSFGKDYSKSNSHHHPLKSLWLFSLQPFSLPQVFLVQPDVISLLLFDLRVELGRGRGISNLDKKARITRPAPLI